MIDQIFVDLDDVCNRFTMHALRFMGCDCSIEDADFPMDVGYDIVAACNLLHPTKNDWTTAQFWTNLGSALWHDMPMRPCCHQLLDDCAKIVGERNVFISTRSLPASCHYSGKMDWIYRHLPTWIFDQVQISRHKETNARPGALLIDDSGGNVSRFRGTRGGQAILVPRPWNELHTQDAYKWVHDGLKLYAMQNARILYDE
jgi:hypothetical protein